MANSRPRKTGLPTSKKSASPSRPPKPTFALIRAANGTRHLAWTVLGIIVVLGVWKGRYDYALIAGIPFACLTTISPPAWTIRRHNFTTRVREITKSQCAVIVSLTGRTAYLVGWGPNVDDSPDSKLWVDLVAAANKKLQGEWYVAGAKDGWNSARLKRQARLPVYVAYPLDLPVVDGLIPLGVTDPEYATRTHRTTLEGDEARWHVKGRYGKGLAFPGHRIRYAWWLLRGKPAVRFTLHILDWDLEQDPYGKLSGRPGTGKTVDQVVIAIGALLQGIPLVLIDGKLSDNFIPFEGHPLVEKVACEDFDECVETLVRLCAFARARYTEKRESTRAKEAGRLVEAVNHQRVLALLDEVTGMLSELDKQEKAQALKMLGQVIRQAREARSNLLLAGQRLDASFFGSAEIRDNCGLGIAKGSHERDAAEMAGVDTVMAANVPGIKGRGVVLINDKTVRVQGFIVPPKVMDEVVRRPARKARNGGDARVPLLPQSSRQVPADVRRLPHTDARDIGENEHGPKARVQGSSTAERLARLREKGSQ